jgi:hypothetical protein
MRTVISLVASMLACALASDAQITTKFSVLTDGTEEVIIRNNSSVGLMALVVTVNQLPQAGSSPFVLYSDPLIEPAAKPLLPGEERVVMMMNPIDRAGHHLHVLEEPIAAAGVFADGTTTGDAALLTRLILRRSNMLFAVETALETLTNAGRRNQPKDQLIGQFRKMADSLDRGYLPPEQRIGRSLYVSIAEKLGALPEPQLGSPFPPASFIDQESAPLRQQRVALLESEPSLLGATPVEIGMTPQRALRAAPPPTSTKHE